MDDRSTGLPLGNSDVASAGISRRHALFGGAALIAGAVLLDGCTHSSGTSPSATAKASGKPVRGGSLRVGVIGQGTLEDLAPSITGPPAIVRGEQLYDRLFDLASDLKSLTPKLALSAEPNADATVWTFKLRDGVTWHDGKTLTAEDVVYTIKGWGDKDSLTFGSLNSLIDYKNVRSSGKLTVIVPLLKPSAQFPTLSAVNASYSVRQSGSSLKTLARRPIGTGPFSYKSFTPGAQSTFVANRDYWQHGGPYIDELIVNSSFTDPTAMVNALEGGQLDVATLLPPLAGKQAAAGAFTLLRAPSPNATFFYMDITSAPFKDVRVRQALKLVADRQALIDGALAGFGTPGNDLFGAGSEYFDSTLKSVRDVDKAKSLLRSAGQSGLTVSLSTSKAFPGAEEAATLFAQQAKEAGVNIRLDVKSAASYYDSSAGFPWHFGQDYSSPQASLAAWYRLFFIEYNETRWDVPGDSALQAAFVEIDKSKAAEKWAIAQKEQFDNGGAIVWGNSDLLDGLAKRVRGIPPSPVNCSNNYRYVDAWVV
ncbi:ABC transporter substrate-binding protein [uncultured Jatrophihabitans sp.]|uniref:ABC transporter substrate-binding protein n=1 Tax=uncultured Jatrophihabitans sp. TaxID=1610747 RepID=UPI0035CB1E25